MEDAMPEDALRVLSIGSMTRGGSTILAMLLGRIPGFLAGMEFQHIWLRGLRENSLCSCGEPFRSCPFWRDVGDEAFGGWGAIDAEEMMSFQRRIERHRHLPLHILPAINAAYTRRLHTYGEIVARLYTAVQVVANCRWLVDNSKNPPTYFTLRSVPGIDLRLVHLVRDPRGVAYSWLKEVPRPDVQAREFMPRLRPFDAAKMWVGFNLSFHLLAGLGVPRRFLKYEDFVADPAGELVAILRWLGEEVSSSDLDFLEGGRPFHLPEAHIFSGNPVRFKKTGLVVREDDEWKTRLPGSAKVIVSATTLPLLSAYGYPLRPGAGGTASGEPVASSSAGSASESGAATPRPKTVMRHAPTGLPSPPAQPPAAAPNGRSPGAGSAGR
jgi:Sulfotransferase family